MRAFVRDGYLHIPRAYPAPLIHNCWRYVIDRYRRLERFHKRGRFPKDVNGWAVAIIEEFQRTKLYDEFITNAKTLKLMQSLLGPDVCVLGYDALWINAPQDKDPVLLKGVHSDHWTGTSVNTIFAKVFLSDCDQYNGMSVCPGTHLQGDVPVRNRAPDPVRTPMTFRPKPIQVPAKAGDLLIWHPLLLHSTTGHSDRNIRISITSRYSSTETAFSSQERALGYRTLSVGPLNQIKRLIGSDSLSPFRTHGGKVGIDRRMQKIYPYSDYVQVKDYSRYLS